MTTTAIERERERAPGARLARALRQGPLHLAILLICMVWIVPSLGLLVSSFRPAAFISMLLPLVVFFSMQRYFVRGILAGSVKG